MKIIKTKLLQEAGGRKQGKYLVTLECSDYDINMLEDLATCYCTINQDDLEPKYDTWLRRVFKQFHKLWRKYDTYP